MRYTLPKLPYEYNALEPYIDAKTMEIHHSKHHQAYIDKLNEVLNKYPDLAEKNLEDLMRNLESLKMDQKDMTALRNHGGGHLNHNFFWTIMGAKKKRHEKLVERIEVKFGSLDEFNNQFTQAAMTRFGSGWAWLVEDEKKELQVYSTANQDSPYLQNHIPLIGLDVWEHAYYLKYQNKRAEYVKNWWNVLKIV
ncbi:superoxide dismutase [Candidatus Roizmanbacteria bacterium RIFCSPHIGHO2_01_FULL_39_12c]|uniref:Superoxide dismutase n=1 Tax=Candidatus Roizmanbacteria bacterium RIFCSPHIGHO2_01_FULL_39_12c TaxID=1802031 RepID=A0A1F7GBM7_9BACT|nr:MAG: superoxide dismutase [Candidatus Roizmanbacteria bacterium RIFCSPHIGHO2_01_FULL_39_12c]OGK47902.1 MAG: superoxide dismutase [Candidatus Roizmanbacteria bacterium RIFCSPLOWO2_01_FULL_40_13]